MRALEAGIALARELARAGVTLLGTGEMGIGNTTAASAITAALTGAAPRDVTGRGTGVDDDGAAAQGRRDRARARAATGPTRATRSTCSRRSAASRSPGSPASMLGAAAARVPVVLDGFIASAAALIAVAARAARRATT